MMNNIKESIRQINTNLMSTKKRSNVVAFMSIGNLQPQRTVVANMAVMYGQAKKKTLIIDTDFSENIFLDTFKLESKVGLLDYLEKQNIDMQEIIVKIPGQNVSIIPSGSDEKNNTEFLIGDPKFDVLLNRSIQDFDCVLINTNMDEKYDNIGNIAQGIDGIILVIDSNRTKKRALYRLIHSIRKRGVNILGYVSV